jgi:uncharacterized protein (DUF2249 family)
MKSTLPALFARPVVCSLFLLSVLSGKGQDPLSWALSLGSTGSDGVTAIANDASGNLYCAGDFEGGIDFDPGHNLTKLNASGPEHFVAKYGASGNLLWAVDIGKGGRVRDISVNSSGVFVLSDENSQLTRLDVNGKIQWVKDLRGKGSAVGMAMVADVYANIYIAGSFAGSVDFDMGSSEFELNARGGSDIFLMRIDNYGDFDWVRRLGGTSDVESATEVAFDPKGDLYLGGYFSGRADFDPSTAEFNIVSNGATDLFIGKYDKLGNLLWVKTVGAEGKDEGLSTMVSDHTGAVVVGGQFSGTLDFDPSETPYELLAEKTDAFILKLDATGKFVWAARMGGNGNETLSGLALDAGKNIYITGTFQNSADFDPGNDFANLVATGNPDGFLVRLDPSGNFLCGNAIGGENAGTWPSAINIDAGGAIILGGSFVGAVDFDVTGNLHRLTTVGKEDIFMMKINSCFNASSKTVGPAIGAVTVFPNPSDGRFVLQSPAGRVFSEILVYDVFGKRMMPLMPQGNSTYAELDLLANPKGVYIIRATTANFEVHTIKILIQ